MVFYEWFVYHTMQVLANAVSTTSLKATKPLNR